MIDLLMDKTSFQFFGTWKELKEQLKVIRFDRANQLRKWRGLVPILWEEWEVEKQPKVKRNENKIQKLMRLLEQLEKQK